MADRCTLHKNKLEDFKKWLDSFGIAYRPGKGSFQVLQVMTQRDGWQVIFKRNDMPEHFSVNDKLMPVIRAYLKDRRCEADAISHDADREMIGSDADFLEDIGNK